MKGEVEGRPPKVVIAVCLVVACGLFAAHAVAGLGSNPANSKKLIGKPIEDYRYDRATKCRKKTPPGTKALVVWLERHTKGQFWGSYRCEKWGQGSYSLHAESRAVDWAMDARDKKMRKQAMRLIKDRLLAEDRRGNDNALARRMGVQGLIYDCKSWWGGDGGLRDYSYCFKDNGKKKKNLNPTAAHIDHIHIELNDPGARKKTSFWRSGIR